MRDEPPTSSTRSMSVVANSAEAMARLVVSIVSASTGRMRPSNSERVIRISVWIDGRKTGSVALTSAERASLASVQSRRNRARADSVVGSLGSSSWRASPSRSVT